MSGPLAGFKVVDFSAVISGPLATMLLADQGADEPRMDIELIRSKLDT